MSETETKVPTCIGIIMDGNRRWAKARGLSSAEGHVAGYEKFKEVLGWIRTAHIPYAFIYALSSENWKREKGEVDHLMNLFRLLADEFKQERAEGKQHGVRMRFVGDLTRFPPDIQQSMREIEELTAHEKVHTLGLAVSYGGREEILRATQVLVREGGEVTEERFSQALWGAGIPDPDLIIRTGGEKRLSNFLPWQSVYSELFFLDTYWPDFSKEDFNAVLLEFERRTRNFGA